MSHASKPHCRLSLRESGERRLSLRESGARGWHVPEPAAKGVAHRLRAVFAGLIGVLAMLCGTVRAETPFYEEDPYDLLTLNSANDNRTLKVKPLNIGENDPDEKPPYTGKLTVRFADAPDKQYELNWNIVVRYETFGHLVLAKANALVDDKSNDRRFDEAYDYFVYLQKRKTSGGQPIHKPWGTTKASRTTFSRKRSTSRTQAVRQLGGPAARALQPQPQAAGDRSGVGARRPPI